MTPFFREVREWGRLAMLQRGENIDTFLLEAAWSPAKPCVRNSALRALQKYAVRRRGSVKGTRPRYRVALFFLRNRR